MVCTMPAGFGRQVVEIKSVRLVRQRARCPPAGENIISRWPSHPEMGTALSCSWCISPAGKPQLAIGEIPYGDLAMGCTIARTSPYLLSSPSLHPTMVSGVQRRCQPTKPRSFRSIMLSFIHLARVHKRLVRFSSVIVSSFLIAAQQGVSVFFIFPSDPPTSIRHLPVRPCAVSLPFGRFLEGGGPSRRAVLL